MNVAATVNYHVSSDKQQAYYIDADGEKGKILSPVLVPTQVKVRDLRNDDLNLEFSHDSVAFVDSVSQISDFNESNDWETVYDQELRDLLGQQINAKEVIVFDHTVRIDDPDSGRKPARNVHSDYSPLGAHQRLKDLIGTEKAQLWEAGHFGFVNVWRPVISPITTAPLGFVRPQSVNEQDWLTLDLIYPERIGQIMGLLANDTHEWIFHSQMTPDKIVFFNIYDNRGLPSIAHSALDLLESGTNQIPRMSIESRTLVHY